MQPLVSILIPAYNARKWIHETVSSTLAQTWPNKEIIVVDDGSTDGTAEILARFNSKTLKVIRQENTGGGGARNTALAAAQGEYIQWLDHDDILPPDKIERQMQRVMQDADESVLYSSRFMTFFFCLDRAVAVENAMCTDLTPVEYFLAKFNEDAWLQIGAYLFSRRLTEKTGPWKSKQSTDDDGDYVARAVAVSTAIHFVSDTHSYWRIGNVASAGHHNNPFIRERAWTTAFHCIDLLIKLENSERTRQASLRFMQLRLLRYGYPDDALLQTQFVGTLQRLGGKVEPPVLGWKHMLASKILGQKTADTIKGYGYIAEMMIKRNVDRLFLVRPGARRAGS